MNLVGLRVWQWMLIGTGVGAAIGYAWSDASLDASRVGDTTLFSRAVADAQRLRAQGKPSPLQNVIVGTPQTDPSGTLVYPVTYDLFARGPDGKLQRQHWSINAKTPFFDARRQQFASIGDFLTRSDVVFSDRSAEGVIRPVGYGAAGGALAIGLLWPGTLRLMVSAGLAVPPAPRERRPKLPKSSASASATGRKITPAVTGRDVADLNALNDELEQRLADGLSLDAITDKRPPAAEPVSVLMSGNGAHATSDSTQTAEAESSSDEAKDYKGEWYPVVRPAAKSEAIPH